MSKRFIRVFPRASTPFVSRLSQQFSVLLL
jgi:hypothetical protein